MHVGTQFEGYKTMLRGLGIKTHNVKFNRNDVSLIKNFITLLQVFRLFLKLKPNIVHLISMKPIIYGGLLSFISPVNALVISVTGLGSMFLKEGKYINSGKNCLIFFIKIVFLYPNLKVIVQNKHDLNHLKFKCNLKIEKVIMIKGSGVDLTKFKFTPIPKGPKIISMISRIIEDKGVLEFIEAAKNLKTKNFKGFFYLIGDVDKDNPSAISQSLIKKWKKEKILKILNHKKEIQKFIKKSTLVVLPSYREGFPKVIMEASACGRPVVTTDVPGCKDAIKNNKTGMLVPVKNSIALSRTILKLSKNRNLLKKLGKAARVYAQKHFNINMVVSEHIKIYKKLLKN